MLTMAQIIVRIALVGAIVTILVVGLFSIIGANLPAIGQFSSSIFTVLGYILQFFSFFADLLLIPKWVLVLYFGFMTFIVGFNFTLIVYAFIQTIYTWVIRN